MRRWLVTAALFLALTPSSFASLANDGVWKAGVWATTMWGNGVWFEDEDLVAVPDVKGQSSAAAADTILEGAGLDLGEDRPRCSAETAGKVIGQNPAAGSMAPAGSLVDIDTSTGDACEGAGIYRQLLLDLDLRL